MNDEEKYLWQESQSNKFLDLVVARPGVCLISSFLGCILLSALAVFVGFLELSDFGERDFLIWKDPTTRNFDLLNLAEEYVEE